MTAFACPPDCGYCCTHLEREARPDDEAFRDLLREHGVYHCGDAQRTGLSVSNAEAEAMRAAAKAQGIRLDLHPRTFLLASRRRVAVVLDWHMPKKVCPLYDADRYQCSAYDARPLVCRAYPVLGLGTRDLAPECPKMPVPIASLRSERRARRGIEEAHAKLDEIGWLVLGDAGSRFTKGLSAREAIARAKRYRKVGVESYH